jgi:hypothetical protein
MSAAVHFVDNERHLLGSGNQQGGKPIAVAFSSTALGNDRLCRDLLAKVNHGVAVVGENGFDQIFTDVMHITIDGGDDNGPLVTPSTFSR